MPSLFDIIGPVMVGPSSSHTAGAARLGHLAMEILGAIPCRADITLSGSFADTGQGHGTDRALLAGLLGLRPDDERLPLAYDLAREAGLSHQFHSAQLGDHPNTARLQLSAGERTCDVTGVSLGGGRVSIRRVDGINTDFSGESPTLVVHNDDRPGLVATVSGLLAGQGVNIATLQVHRTSRGGSAVMVIECDGALPKELLASLGSTSGVRTAMYIKGEQ